MIGVPMLSSHPMPFAIAQTVPDRSDSFSVQQAGEVNERQGVQGLYDSSRKAKEFMRDEIRIEERQGRVLSSPSYRAPNPARQFDGSFTTYDLRLSPSKAIGKAVAPNAGLEI